MYKNRLQPQAHIFPNPAPAFTTFCTSSRGVSVYLYGASVKLPTWVMLIVAGPQSFSAVAVS